MTSGRRILYVDDDRDSLELVRFMLTGLTANADLSLETVETAKEALLLIEKDPFDLYIFDYRMPELSGIELCRFTREIHPEKPVLFFSAMARSIDIAEGLNAGANEYLLKPDDLEKIPETVKRLLEESLTAVQAAENTSIVKVDAAPQSNFQAQIIKPVTWRNDVRAFADGFSKRQIEKFSAAERNAKAAKNKSAVIPAGFFRQLDKPTFLAGTAIFSLIIFHFLFQSIFVGNERVSTETEMAKNQNLVLKPVNSQNADMEISIKNQNDFAKMAEAEAQLIVQPESRVLPSRAVTRKKESRETRAVRLRRAEKILTGV